MACSRCKALLLTAQKRFAATNKPSSALIITPSLKVRCCTAAVRSGPDGSLKGAPIHFILSFPHDYPHEQPECRLLQPIPHPNVKPATSSGTIHVLHANSNTQQLPTGVVAGSAAACRSVPQIIVMRLFASTCPGCYKMVCRVCGILSHA